APPGTGGPPVRLSNGWSMTRPDAGSGSRQMPAPARHVSGPRSVVATVGVEWPGPAGSTTVGSAPPAAQITPPTVTTAIAAAATAATVRGVRRDRVGGRVIAP